MFVEAPGLGWLLRRSEPIPVYGKPARWRWRERHRRECLRVPVVDTCMEWLRRGESIGIFPEGTRNRQGGGLLRGRLGLGQLVLAAAAAPAMPAMPAVPVVPIAIRYPASTRLGRTPRVGRLVLSIGEPLDFASERRQSASAPACRRELARHVVDRVMAALAAGVGEAQGSRNRSRSEAR
jgi:1-acyl-sn-glycerol-3-phosphate acyltransferase